MVYIGKFNDKTVAVKEFHNKDWFDVELLNHLTLLPISPRINRAIAYDLDKKSLLLPYHRGFKYVIFYMKTSKVMILIYSAQHSEI